MAKKSATAAHVEMVTARRDLAVNGVHDCRESGDKATKRGPVTIPAGTIGVVDKDLGDERIVVFSWQMYSTVMARIPADDLVPQR